MMSAIDASQLEPSETSACWCVCVKRYGECLGELRSDVAGARQMIKRLAFVEARHFDGPFDGRALAVDLKIRVPLRNREQSADRGPARNGD